MNYSVKSDPLLMTKGIENTKCMVVIITEEYKRKVNGDDMGDNCYYEFAYGVEQLRPQKMIPVVMEGGMCNPREWRGELGGALGTILFANLIEDDVPSFTAGCDDVHRKIMHIIGSTCEQDFRQAVSSAASAPISSLCAPSYGGLVGANLASSVRYLFIYFYWTFEKSVCFYLLFLINFLFYLHVFTCSKDINFIASSCSYGTESFLRAQCSPCTILSTHC